MNIALFYNLRDRLCATAVAGCATIGEDFRLQRAVEEFEPLAKTNKVFGRLYAMCGELIADGKPALLADCIALCDALAVTQGTFKDNSEISEFEGVKSCEPSDMSYSALSNSDIKTESRDPRVINKYLSTLKANTSEYTKQFIMNFGRDLVPMLKEKVDLTNPKEHGMIVEYIGLLAGADENDWYILLIEKEDNPPAVRVHAVSNLVYDKSNADRLLELYKTEKANIRDAAAFALVQLDVPEAETILKKVTTGKFAKKNAELIAMSGNKIAVDFAVDYAEKWVEERENNPKATTFVYDYDLAMRMLANKPDVEDIINKIAEHNGKNISHMALAEMIITNLGRHKNEKYRTLIENLYKRNPDYFTMPYLFMIMTEDRGIEITDLPELVDKYRYNLLIPLYLIRYDNFRNCYTLPPQFTQYKHYDDKLVKTIPVSDSKFEKILELISDTSYMKTSLLKLKLQNRKYYDYSAQKVKGDVYADQCVFLAYRIFEYLYNNAPLFDDKSGIRSLAVAFYKEAMKYFPRDDVFKSLCIHDVQYIRENPDLLENMMMFRMEHFDNYIREGYFDEIPKDVLDVIIPKIYRKLKKLKSINIKKNVLSQQIHVLEHFMKTHDYDKEKILKGNE